jgi:hydroxylamine reductase
MFCYQCQETAKNTGCTVRCVCGKTEEVAQLQDLLIYTLKGISEIVVNGKADVSSLGNTNYEVLSSLFMTITNANFDDGALEKQIIKMIAIRDELKNSVSLNALYDAATFSVDSKESMLKKAASVVCWQLKMKMCVRSVR